MLPLWSADEMRVYSCCYHYGDARSGTSLDIPYDQTRLDGNDPGTYRLGNLSGTWVFGGKYMLSQWKSPMDMSIPGFNPLFDPAAKIYHSLPSIVGRPKMDWDKAGAPYCQQAYAALDGQYVWLECTDADYLIDLATFTSQAYPAYALSWVNWSADGKFAQMNADLPPQDLPRQILSTGSKDMAGLPPGLSCSAWHPVDDVLVCLSRDGRTLSLWDAGSMSTRKEVALPVAFQGWDIDQFVWSPDRRQLTLLAKDGSYWEIDYPGLDHLEQLTPPMPAAIYLRPIRWAPDGSALTFMSDMDVYIVNAKR